MRSALQIVLLSFSKAVVRREGKRKKMLEDSHVIIGVFFSFYVYFVVNIFNIIFYFNLFIYIIFVIHLGYYWDKINVHWIRYHSIQKLRVMGYGGNEREEEVGLSSNGREKLASSANETPPPTLQSRQ